MRLFVALEIPEALREEVSRRCEELRRRLSPARWVRSDNLHLTLLFLGEVEREAVPGLASALGPAFAASPPFELRLAKGGTFPPHRPARVAWVGAAGSPEILSLQKRVEEAARRAVGLAPEPRTFHPHLTLARPRAPWRHRDRNAFVEAFSGTLGESFEVRRGVLFESRLPSRGGGAAWGEGPVYVPVEAFPLASEAAPA
jgi:2'-5' RNA ligase